MNTSVRLLWTETLQPAVSAEPDAILDTDSFIITYQVFLQSSASFEHNTRLTAGFYKHKMHTHTHWRQLSHGRGASTHRVKVENSLTHNHIYYKSNKAVTNRLHSTMKESLLTSL